jgi:hypothetical protein
MKTFKLIASLVVVAATVVAVNTGSAGATGSHTQVCDVPKLKLGETAGKNMKENGDTLTATFVVEGQNCTTPVTLAIWESPSANGQPINDQKLFTHTTSTYGPGTWTISAKLPDCFYQADLLVGDKATAPDGTPNYAYQNGEILKVHPLRDFKYGGARKCEDTPPETPEDPKEEPKPQTKSTVTTLTKTGPASIIGTFAGISASGTVAHAIVSRKKRQ